MASMKVEDVRARRVAVVPGAVPGAAVATFAAGAFGVVIAAVGRAGGRLDGPPFAWYALPASPPPPDVVPLADVAGEPVPGEPLGEPVLLLEPEAPVVPEAALSADPVDVAVGYPVDGLAPGDLADGVVVTDRPGGLAAVALHEGTTEDLADVYRELSVWLRDRALDVGGERWEEYLGDDAEPQVRIVWPLA